MFAFGGRTEEVAPPPVLPSGGKRLIRILRMLNAEERKGTMPSKRQRIAVYLGTEEYGAIQENVNRGGHITLDLRPSDVSIVIPGFESVSYTHLGLFEGGFAVAHENM
jgi:hypothetical protein